MNVRARVVGRGTIDPSADIFLDRVSLRHEDFSGRDLTYFGAHGSLLEGCRFDDSNIGEGSFGEGRVTSKYVDCSFDRARIRFAPGGFARFVRCSFREADLRDWFCFAVELIDCTFSGTLRKVVFNGTVPPRHRKAVKRERNEFHGNDFSEADLIDVAFRTGVDLSQQRLPSRPEYLYLPDAAGALLRAREGVALWETEDSRREAASLIDLFAEEVRDGQVQLLVRGDDFYSVQGAAVVDGVIALLRAATS